MFKKFFFKPISLAVLALVGWSCVVAAVYYFNHQLLGDFIVTLAKNNAYTNINKDIAYRKWSTNHGGVYVTVDKDTPPNPYLNVKDRDINISGKQLTLVNPAYMVRLVAEMDTQLVVTKTHLTSLKPIRPANGPDEWEVKALYSFERDGKKEAYELDESNSKLRVMKPLIVEKGCLKCHGDQVYKVGDIRGGLAVTIDMKPFMAQQEKNINFLVFSSVLLWLLGSLLIVVAYKVIMRYVTSIKENQEKLKQNEIYLQTIITTEPECIKIIDADGKLIYMNPAGLKAIEADSLEQVAGKLVLDIITPEYREAFTNLHERAINGFSGQLEFEIVGLKGGRRWLESHSVPMQSGDKTVHLGAARDITERKNLEMKLNIIDRFREHFVTQANPFLMYDALRDDLLQLTGSTFGFIGEVVEETDNSRYLKVYSISNISWDADTRKLYAEYKDKGFEFRKLDNLFGRVVTHEEVVISNNPLSDPRRAGLPKGHPPIDSFLGLPVYYGKKLVGEIGLANRAGGYDQAIVDALAPVVSALGQIIAARQEEEAKKRAEELRRLLLSSLGDGVYGVDASGKCTFINGAALQMLGFEHNEVIGFDQHELFHYHRKDGMPYPEFECPLHKTLQDGVIRDAEEVFIRKNGEFFDVHIKVSPMVVSGELTGAVVVFQDITERKQMGDALKTLNQELMVKVEQEVARRMQIEEQRQNEKTALIQTEKMAQLGNMIGAILHQWKQPLNVIALVAQDILESYRYEELNEGVLQNSVKAIMSNVSFMASTADDFRDFYKPSKEKKVFSIMEQINSVTNLLSKQLTISSIGLQVEGDAAISTNGYTSEFKQVVLNIINNAKDVLEERKIQDAKIEITLSTEDDMAVLKISDNGGGIPEALLPDKLFEQFASTKGEKGTGIGLSLCKTIIEENMGGKLSARNIEGGAELRIELPVASA